ncbi:hypothetical protein QUB70_17985 [Microcoleus sp. A003_D6]|uniref:hypothetical protein n=1 Tax=Microcoleus sp. A003_D6 TaxID=3055266 RepID=UPI002FD610B7
MTVGSWQLAVDSWQLTVGSWQLTVESEVFRQLTFDSKICKQSTVNNCPLSATKVLIQNY